MPTGTVQQQVYSEPCQTSKLELFPSYMFDGGLNTLLIVNSKNPVKNIRRSIFRAFYTQFSKLTISWYKTPFALSKFNDLVHITAVCDRISKPYLVNEEHIWTTWVTTINFVSIFYHDTKLFVIFTEIS